jgi:hypothetical protein
MTSKNLILAAIHLTEKCGPRLTETNAITAIAALFVITRI